MQVIIHLILFSQFLATYVSGYLRLDRISERRMSMAQPLLADAIMSQTYISIPTFPLLVLPVTIEYPDAHGYDAEA